MLTAEDVDTLVAEIKTLRAIVAGLQLKVHALEQRPLGLHWVGVWDNQRSYKPDEGVTDEGSIWVCLKANAGKRPKANTPEYWRLCVKRGADGKDGRP